VAELLDDSELGHIADDLIRGVESDDASRAEWLATRTDAIEMNALVASASTKMAPIVLMLAFVAPECGRISQITRLKMAVLLLACGRHRLRGEQCQSGLPKTKPAGVNRRALYANFAGSRRTRAHAVPAILPSVSAIR
jgi:hypothetical protein